jgi:isorenieratene synthase
LREVPRMGCSEITPYQVIVVGAGVAGLTAALHLAERGLRPLILEADAERLGGRLKGGPSVEFEHAGGVWRFPGEHGIHGIWSPYRNFQAVLARHGIRPVLVPAQKEEWVLGVDQWVRRAEVGSAIRGSWVPAPLHYLGLFARPRFLAMLTLRDIASMFRVLGGLLSALSIDPLYEEQPLPGMSLTDFCDGWSPALTAFFAGLTRNALPVNPEEVPASGFIAFLRFYTLLRRDAWAFSYLPTDGGTAIIQPLVTKLRAYGAEIIIGARVTRLEGGSDGWRVVWGQEGEHFKSADGAYVILATDAPAAESLLRESPDTAPLAASLCLPSGWPTAVVRLWFDRSPRALRAEAGIFSGDFILDNFFWLHRIYDDYVRWSRATGGSAIESHIYGPPELLEKPDATLLAQAIVDVGRVWPELKRRLVHSTLTRNEPTHTLLHVGPPEEHLGITTPWPRLFCCGDWVRDRCPAMFLERACVTGIKAANAILGDLSLEPWPLLTHPQPEAFAATMELSMHNVRQSLRRRRKAKQERAL